MEYTPKELHIKAAQLKHSRWVIEECPGCDYKIGYLFSNENVTYDPGCRCEGSNNLPVKSSWETVAAEVNTLLKTDKKEEVIKYWQL